MTQTSELINFNCLDVLPWLPESHIDMVLADLPYGTTACKWDKVIPFEPLWAELHRVCKPNSAMCMFGSEPFSSHLRVSNLKEFKYDWVWLKASGSNFATVKFAPIKAHETVSVFSKERHKYVPIMEPRAANGLIRVKSPFKSNTQAGEAASGGIKTNHAGKEYAELRNPFSYQYYNNRDKDRGYHPTQKPIALLEYLIKTYTNEGDTVLDPTMGSGSTGVACKNLNRNFIGIEMDDIYFDICRKRILGK